MVNKYKEQALQGMNEVIEQVRPQASEMDDNETLKLLNQLEEYLENDRPVKAVSVAKKVRERAMANGYAVDIE